MSNGIKCFHILPCNDDRDHTVNGRGVCWCNPVEVDNGPDSFPIYRHNSEDGREFVEEKLGEVISPDKGWYFDTVVIY
jgi:hypothetical protein